VVVVPEWWWFLGGVYCGLVLMLATLLARHFEQIRTDMGKVLGGGLAPWYAVLLFWLSLSLLAPVVLVLTLLGIRLPGR